MAPSMRGTPVQRAKVLGQVVATTKHPTMIGIRLLAMQAIDGAGKPDGDPILVVDALGAAVGAIAIITSDGKAARSLVGIEATPIRYTTVGLEDSPHQR
jgi:ethanolamine utilization protein EutN